MLNIGSINGYCGEANQLAYSISKGALMTLTRNLADALGRGSRARQPVQPGLGAVAQRVQAEDVAKASPPDWPEHPPAAFAPSGRLMTPEQIATAAVYWVGDESRPVSGTVARTGAVPGHRPQSGEGMKHERWPTARVRSTADRVPIMFEFSVFIRHSTALSLMPQLAAFPKAWLDDLCVNGKMTVRQWLELGATLDVDGFEFYSGFLELQDRANWPAVRRMVR